MNCELINQQGIRERLAARLSHPEEYADQPLIIWHADFRDGIQERIIREVFNEFNEGKPLEEKKWFLPTMLGNDHQTAYNFSLSHIVKPGKKQIVGMYVLEPTLLAINYKRRPESLATYQQIINDRGAGELQMAPGIPVVAFMNINQPWFETPGIYTNAEQYLFQPDFEEFTQWAKEANILPDSILSFIRGDGNPEGIAYRWYNYFNNIPGEPRKGVDYPACWLELMKDTRLKQRVEGGNESIEELLNKNIVTWKI